MGCEEKSSDQAVSVMDGHFGTWVGLPVDKSGLILISVLTRHGLKPMTVLLPHQLYMRDVLALQSEGDVVVTAVPVAADHINVSAALRA
jgi:hypothetical protein